MWGTGRPRREFPHVGDLADACIHPMRVYSAEEPVNIGYGEDLSIAELAERVKAVVDYEGGPPLQRRAARRAGCWMSRG